MKKLTAIVLLLSLCLGVFAAGTQEVAPTAAVWESQGTPLADVRIRQALRLAIDMETIVDELFEGKAQRAVAMTSPGSWLADGLDPYTYNPEKAKALLDEAGWPKDYTLDVVYYYGDQQTVDLMAIIQQYWAAVGVKSSFRKLEGDLASQLWVPPADRKNGPSAVKWDLAYAAVAALSENEFYDRFESTASNNSSIPWQEGLDELVQATRATADVEKQKAAFKALQRDINENMYNIPLYHQLSFIYTSNKLDIAGSDLGNDQFSFNKNILDWKIDSKDGMMYTNGGPMEFYEAPMVNPGLYLYQELLFDKLINADANLTPTDGMLAKSYSVSPDGMQITFDLRSDVKWHDGAAFSAQDVVFSIEYFLKTPGLNAVALNTFKSIKGASAYVEGSASSLSGIKVDGNKVTITFEILDPNALLTFSQWPMLPSHILKGSNPVTFQQNAFWQKPVGTGPFKVKETVLGNYAILERNASYYRSGTGNIKTIFMNASSENDSNLVKNAESGRIDYAWSKSVADSLSIEKIDHMAVTPVNIRYTRVFWVNQFPHPANIK
ncbi:ABC transporter substrate-binding protein [Sphaerochaeta sp. S2]|uniref:ABC transporter substrate-binding protein n=1 Tax=Sphaerochaeta sp. S2 TaxID=2798868 RepID=UPI0018E92AEA|nr:ABC transporter substrate-binding protein [Sphaerochaeta sp. S2]MBJ2357053.1 peptide ABC transporter substrate-binding protein [Sphaerochaeta sp. S2]